MIFRRILAAALLVCAVLAVLTACQGEPGGSENADSDGENSREPDS